MTPEQHNKYLGFAHLVYAILHSLMGFGLGVMMFVMFSTMEPMPGAPSLLPEMFITIACFVLLFTVGWCIPSMIAAYGLLKRKRWAKTAGIVAAVFAAPQLPVGTPVSIYTFWFLFGESGRSLYDRTAQTLSARQSDWPTRRS